MKEFIRTMDKIAVIGMGYVGLPLSLLLARDHKVIGFDVDEARIKKMQDGIPTISEPGIDELMKDQTIQNNIVYSSNPIDIKKAKIKIITVGTPYDIKSDYIDYSQINAAIEILSGNLNKGDIVILKSTVPPGTTNGVIRSKLESFGFQIPSDIGISFSPERMVEGLAVNDFKTLPKIIGASDPETLEICGNIIGSLGGKVIKVSSIETAEMIKMVDNYSRFVFLGLTNEFALISERVGVDVLELIRAAKDDYPRNSGLLLPGPGVGGSCLNKDPFILKAHMKKDGLSLKMVDCAQYVNGNMPYHVCELVERFAGLRNRITVVGVAFKGDTNDTRFTPAYQIHDYLVEKGFHVTMSDPFVREDKVKIISDEFLALKGSNILLILTDHARYKNIDLQKLKDVMDENPLIIDTRGIVKRDEAVKYGFEYHGLGRL